MKRQHFRFEATAGPEQLFASLAATAADSRFAAAAPAFDFDWMRRRVSLSANDRDTLRAMSAAFLASAEAALGVSGQLLPGDVRDEDGRCTVPFGVLLNPPDVFVQLVASMLVETGCPDVRAEYNGHGLSFPVGSIAKALRHVDLVRQFPVPPYIRIIDDGIR